MRLDGITCKRCDNRCERGFSTGVFCRYVVDNETQEVAKILDKFIRSITAIDLGIHYELLKIFASDHIDFDEKIQNKNIRAMIKILAEIELNYKISIAKDASNYHYSVAKAYYKRLFGESQDDDYVIKIIEGDKAEYI